MAKYLKNIKSFKDLKNQYRELIKKNHPDNGGSVEAMQDINAEYDALFKIWKDRAIKESTITEEEKTETAESTRRSFYTSNGWEGSRYSSNMTLKEISKIVKNYTKEKYPTFKFSVRTHYASMCQELTAELTEAPFDIYMSVEEFKNMNWYEVHEYTDGNGEIKSYRSYNNTISDLLKIWRANWIFKLDSYSDDDIINKYAELAENPSSNHFYLLLREDVKAMIDDVDNFVNSYNYSDCDGMIDYFDVNFYYFGCKYGSVKTVVKAARIKNQDAEVVKESRPEQKEVAAIESSDESFSITESEHTQTHEKIFLVKVLKSLSKDNYNLLNSFFKQNGGYYSKFTHSFIFKYDPTEFLKGVKIA